MPTIQYVTKISEEGVISTFENISKAIEKTADDSEKLSASSTENAGKMNVSWSQVGATFAVTGTAIATAGVAIIGTLFEMAESTSKLGAEMHDMSQRTGLSSKALSEFGYAAGLSGASLDNVITGLRLLATHMEDVVSKGGAAGDTFKKLGISVTDANGALRPTSDVLLDVADKFHNMEDGATKSAIAVELFGRGGLALIPMLNEGREGLSKMSAEAERLGIVFDTGAAAKADEFDDALFTLHQGVTGLTRAIGEEAYPILLKWIQGVTDVIVKTKDWVNANPNLATGLLEVATAMVGAGGVLLGLGGLIATIPKAIDLIGTMGSTATVAKVSIGGAGEAITTLSTTSVAGTGAIGGLSAGLQAVGGFLVGPGGIVLAIAAAAAGLVYLVNTTDAGHKGLVAFADSVKQSGIELWEATKATTGFIAELAKMAWDEFTKQVNQNIQQWKDLWAAIVNTTGAFGQWLDKSAPGSWEKFKQGVKDGATGPMEGLTGVLISNTEWMKKFTDQGGPAVLQPMTLAQSLLTGQINQTGAATLLTAGWSAQSSEAFQEQKRKEKDGQDIVLAATKEQMAIDQKYREAINTIYAEQVAAAAKFVDAWVKGFEVTSAEADKYTAAVERSEVATSKLGATSLDTMVLIGQAQATMSDQWDMLNGKNFNSSAKLFNDINGLRETDVDAAVVAAKQRLDTDQKAYDDSTKAAQKATDAQIKEADRYKDAFVASIATLNTRIAESFADMIVNAKFNMDSLISIAQSTAKSMLSAFLSGLMSPLTNALADLGKSLSNTLFGAIGGGGSGGGLLGNLLGGLTGGGSGGIGGGSLLGALGGTAGIATLGIGAAVGGAIAWIKSQAHWEANTFVNDLQNPLINPEGTGVINQLVNSFNQKAAAGSLGPEEAANYVTQLQAVVAAFDQAAEQFATGGSDERTVATQGRATIDSFAATLTADMQKTIANLAAPVTSMVVAPAQAAAATGGTGGLSFDFAGGTGWNVVPSYVAPLVNPPVVTMTGVDPWADFNWNVNRFYEEWNAGTLTYYDAMEHINNLANDIGLLNDPSADSYIGSFIDGMQNVAAMLDHSHADGLNYVPYDNYPALLHRGERVQTAAQARSGGGMTIDFGGIQIYGAPTDSPEDFADKLEAAIERKMMSGAFRERMAKLGSGARV